MPEQQLSEIVIPPVPPEIFDPTDLCNDAYPWWPNMNWANPEFHDRILWMQERVKFTIVGWNTPYSPAAGPGAGAKEFRGPTHMIIRTENGREVPIDVINLGMDLPNGGGQLECSALATIFQLIYDAPLQQPGPKYPGFAKRHPAGGADPVGAEWPEHKLNATNRKIFHPSSAFDPTKWPYKGGAEKPTEFWRPDGRYTLGMTSTISGSWLSPGGIKVTPEYFWAKDYNSNAN